MVDRQSIHFVLDTIRGWELPSSSLDPQFFQILGLEFAADSRLGIVNFYNNITIADRGSILSKLDHDLDDLNSIAGKELGMNCS
ncbi:hypothetical protein NDU88_006451 [Pleurodeles waltl]|uniref:Uncharacterized protein n=1 Tax=Pleurodeles waltl TaxID=8319 RepID=A0AAV7RS25_PLEWA|nr:hypothetical protein NDU88_006451 [Pleurodeles waltl]